MAFGGQRGTLQVAANSITNPTVVAGSVACIVGDLIYVVIAEQISNTPSNSTMPTDNLGNTYAQTQNGTLSGALVSGHAYYSRVTKPGTLTAINITATASSNNVAAVAVVVEGPFDSSLLDANPTNITSDITTPYGCPASGTLAQANEVILAWGAANYGTVWTATSPNILVLDLPSQSVVKVALGLQTVAVTTTVSPVFAAAGNPGGAVLGTSSFRRDRSLQVTGPFAQLNWPNQLGRLTPYPLDLRSWARGYTALTFPAPAVTVVPRAPVIAPRWPAPYHISLRSFFGRVISESYPESPPESPPYSPPYAEIPYRGEWPLPLARPYAVSLRTWIGRRPDIPPDSPPTRDNDCLLLLEDGTGNLILEDYLGLLALESCVPFVQHVWPVPRAPAYAVTLRTWVGRVIVAAPPSSPPESPPESPPSSPPEQAPFAQYVWPRTRAPDYALSLRTFIGGKTVEVPPSSPPESPPESPAAVTFIPRAPVYGPLWYAYPAARPWLNVSWSDFLRVDLIPPSSPPESPAESPPESPPESPGAITLVPRTPIYGPLWWAYPRARPWLTASFADFLRVTLVQPEGNQRNWPLARGVSYPIDLRTFIGPKTAEAAPSSPPESPPESPVESPPEPLPFSQTDWPNPRAPLFTHSLRTWLDQTRIALNFTPVVTSQRDWPLPRGPFQPDRSFIATFPRVLVGQDRLPIRQQHWPLTPAPFQFVRSITASYNRNLVGQDRLPHRQQHWPLTPAPFQFNRGFIFNPLQVPILFPGPQPPPIDHRDTISSRGAQYVPSRRPQYNPERPPQYNPTRPKQ